MMTSIKAKKGTPFEKLVAYNLQRAGYKVIRPDDNTAGIDLIATSGEAVLYIECKHHKGFSWNELHRIFMKTKSHCAEDIAYPLVVFRANRQPITVMGLNNDVFYSIPVITTFENWFGLKPEKLPKGYKVWKN